MATVVSVGLATAQGSAADLLARKELTPPMPLLWAADGGTADRWTTSHLCRPAHHVEPSLRGAERWYRLARLALSECCGDAPPPAGTPLLVASCNGMAEGFGPEVWTTSFDVDELLDTVPWSTLPWTTAGSLAVASTACASGLHALYLAERWLTHPVEEVVVLAVDVLSAATHANFEALRILAPELQSPWQSQTEGFVLGEAAVALRLRLEGDGPQLSGLTLSQDLQTGDGLDRVLANLDTEHVNLILGQGTGPADVDDAELAALRHLDAAIRLTTPLFHFGHTLGCSGLLSVALAALHRQTTLAALEMPLPQATEGRKLLDEPAQQTEGETLIVCRALGGACAALVVGDQPQRAHPAVATWAPTTAQGPIQHPLLRRLVAEAPEHRPDLPPELLVVHLDEPLVPPPRAVLGGRLLPSAVLEMTPGRVAMLLAQMWGYTGPTLCLVGRDQNRLDHLLGDRTHVVTISPQAETVNWR